MRDNSHTVIGTVRKAVTKWRKQCDWSRETVTQEIVSKFYSMGGDKVTNIYFDPETRDPYERQKVMADKLFRWLDDETKDTNFLPVNFLPYILAALPMDMRIECTNDILQLTGLAVRVGESAIPECLVKVLQTLAKESGEATASMADLLDGASPEEVAHAEVQVTEAMEACKAALEMIGKLRAGA